MAAGTLAAAYQVGKFAFKKGRELAARIKRKKIDALAPALRDPNMQALKTEAQSDARAAETGAGYDTKRVDAGSASAIKAAIMSGNKGAFSDITSAANQQKMALRQSAEERRQKAVETKGAVTEAISKRQMDLQRLDQERKDLRNEAEIGGSSQGSEALEPGAVDAAAQGKDGEKAAGAGLAALAKKRLAKQQAKGKKGKIAEMLLKGLGGGGEAAGN